MKKTNYKRLVRKLEGDTNTDAGFLKRKTKKLAKYKKLIKE